MSTAPKYGLGARVYHPHHGFGLVTHVSTLAVGSRPGGYVTVQWDDRPYCTVRSAELRWEADAVRLGLTPPLPAEYNYQCEHCLWRTDGLNTYLAHRCEPGLRALRTYQLAVGAL